MTKKLGPREPSRKEEGLTVLFDGECPLCRAAVERLKRWDPDGLLSFLPVQSREVGERYSGMSREALQESLHLVDRAGRAWAGSEAVEKLTEVLPGWRWARGFFRLPLARPLARRVYGWVARNRYRLSCEDHCR